MLWSAKLLNLNHSGFTSSGISGKGVCVQLWYHMYGRGMGSLNIYQQSEEGHQTLIFTQIGDQGQMWRFAQGTLLPRVQPYRVSHRDLADECHGVFLRK